ncbi:hypothetical protein JMJ35_000101 [Cladonia borealis]|uniref:Uncharacterized protein n=1 Tax=Cladonia borealis TaxID=184061 RepID=A0AA39RA45_9LECA|nr:hypothetical protein JMJ35_000101 [Cladonia borealis]
MFRDSSRYRYGASTWTVTARITTTLTDVEGKCYLLKCAEDAQGKAMVKGEFNSMSELYKIAPKFVPKLNVSNTNTNYFLCDCIEMNPDPTQLCTKLVQMHQASESPTGQFGFHLNTCQKTSPSTDSMES